MNILCRTLCCTNHAQEPLLVLPQQIIRLILRGGPQVPRPLAAVKAQKAEHYLQLARIMVTRFPTDTSGRAAEFLVDLIRNRTPGPLHPLPWFEEPGNPDEIKIQGQAAVLGRVLPAMKFQAQIRVRD